LIKNLERNDHTILIDDMRILGKLGWGLGTVKEIVIQKLLEINPNYSIMYIDGEEPNDIMVAKITQ